MYLYASLYNLVILFCVYVFGDRRHKVNVLSSQVKILQVGALIVGTGGTVSTHFAILGRKSEIHR